MKRTLMTYGFSLITATVIVACAATPTSTNRGAGSVKLLSARDAAEQAFVYRLVTDRSPASAVVDRTVTGQCKGGESGYGATVEAETGVLLVCWMDAKGTIMAWGHESSLSSSPASKTTDDRSRTMKCPECTDRHR